MDFASKDSHKKKVLVIGAAGSIGTHLLKELISRNYTPIAALHRRWYTCCCAVVLYFPNSCYYIFEYFLSPIPDELAKHTICEFGFNIREEETIRTIFEKHKGTIDSVWNLAAPLSVDTANDPTSAYDITVGGMKRVLSCMQEFGVQKIYFSDSIGKT